MIHNRDEFLAKFDGLMRPHLRELVEWDYGKGENQPTIPGWVSEAVLDWLLIEYVGIARDFVEMDISDAITVLVRAWFNRNDLVAVSTAPAMPVPQPSTTGEVN